MNAAVIVPRDSVDLLDKVVIFDGKPVPTLEFFQ